MVAVRSYPVTNTYRVEVSGWDTTREFFVEKTDLEWNENEARRLKLSRALRKGSMVFVRLLQPTDQAEIFPVAYEVDPIEPMTGDTCEFRLFRVRPRSRERPTGMP